MRSLIVKYIAELILLVTTTFAVYLLLRGHDEPGGGFAAGIAATLGILLQAVANALHAQAESLRTQAATDDEDLIEIIPGPWTPFSAGLRRGL